MLTAAFWLLLVAALGGLTMAVLDGATRPLRIGHGAIAGVGLLCLLIGAFIQPGLLVWSAFALVAIGFGAGAVFFGVIFKHRAPPRFLIIGHGALNGLGVLLLGIQVFS
ncbi:hypothetical protein T35B1_00335 [Salinisphaera shabanensis T35B1]|jgi:hypothetical protein|uniref:Uncharacterized protein n=1 Tax=Salinisphaera shabanensis E1L3A TaxID=1033802 RepID=U2G347_9GAMM|nr:hypothetical protein [Salinisphaera shabanensis]ERJ20553.1 hypothetical protein SSPSH_000663 [Salinisphaera shabanensis E1L3A]